MDEMLELLRRMPPRGWGYSWGLKPRHGPVDPLWMRHYLYVHDGERCLTLRADSVTELAVKTEMLLEGEWEVMG